MWKKNPHGTQVFKTRVPPFYFPPSILLLLPLLHRASVLLQPDSPPCVCSSPTRSSSSILLRSCKFEDQIIHPASVLLQPDHLPLFFFRALDRFPLPFFFFRPVDRLFPLFFFISGSGFMELESKKLEFHVDKLFHLNSPNSSLWGWILSPNSSFTDLRC